MTSRKELNEVYRGHVDEIHALLPGGAVTYHDLFGIVLYSCLDETEDGPVVLARKTINSIRKAFSEFVDPEVYLGRVNINDDGKPFYITYFTDFAIRIIAESGNIHDFCSKMDLPDEKVKGLEDVEKAFIFLRDKLREKNEKNFRS